MQQNYSSKNLIQSVDGFPSLISDPWLNGRLLAFHSCSDIWACGGSVISAQSNYSGGKTYRWAYIRIKKNV